MGQNSSVAVATSKLAPDNGNIIVDASDSFVSGIKLRSTGIIPISELIKQEKCSKNIQKLEQTYYKRNTTDTVKVKEGKQKKNKADFIDTSFDEGRRQWVRVDAELKKPFESDAVKIGLNRPSKTKIHELALVVNKKKALRREPKTKTTKANNQKGNLETKAANTREKNTKQENVDEPKHVRPSTQKDARKHAGVQAQVNNKQKTKTTAKTTTEPPIKAIPDKTNETNAKFKEISVQTISQDKATSYENIKQLYKRNNNDDKKNAKSKIQHEENNKQQSKLSKNKVHKMKDFEEESTHQFQKHQISEQKKRSRRYGNNLKMETILSCAIQPERYFQSDTTNENMLERRTGRNYINRKLAGGFYNKGDNYYGKNIDRFNSCELLPPAISIFPTASTLEQAIKEHRKYVSAKEALESWKQIHTWKQHRKQFDITRNEYHQDNFDVATQTQTQTVSHSSENIIRGSKSNHYLQPRPVLNDIIVPSEKHLYKDFIMKMENCLQNHSRLCELNAKRHCDGKFTWVQDKYRRWHKIMFDEFKN